MIESFLPYEEMIAYETLWTRDCASIKKVAEYLQNTDRPSQAQFSLLEEDVKEQISEYFSKIKKDFSVITAESYQYPEGIDTAAMTAAIAAKGKVIGVIGTPINEYYPKNNFDLQNEVSKNHLLVSHVPIFRYANEHFNTKRFYFPQRNVTMAAISDATIIVEASETSGTLTQARACVSMNRKLFILNSCFENSSITWPSKYEAKGAIRVKDINDILKELGE